MPGLRVEVCYALPDGSHVRELRVAPGTTAGEALERSGLLAEFSIDLSHHGLGVFGGACAPSTVLKDGDRVEIYRPLPADPKEMRRRAARTGR